MGLVLLPCGIVKISMWSSTSYATIEVTLGLILNTFL